VANLTGNPGGAVPPLANVQTNRATGRRKKTPEAFERLMQLVRRQRFSRLCVLMNPYPAGRAVHPDLAGYRVFSNHPGPKPQMPSGFFLKKKPTSTMPERPQQLEKR